ncbi:MAG: hypothetical protein QXW98_06535 [Candidatus Caldarchaeum sp.]
MAQKPEDKKDKPFYESMEDVPENLKHIHGARLTLDQVNALVNCVETVAESMRKDGVDRKEALSKAFAICMANFIKRHKIVTHKDGTKAWALKKTAT